MNTHDIQRYTVSGDIAYPVHEDSEGDYVTYEDHIAAIEADRKTTEKQLAAYSRLVNSLESRLTDLQAQHDELKKSTNPELLASERAANAILTEELEADRKRSGEPFKGRRIDDVVRGLQASVAVGSDGEWVSIRREARDSAINRLQELNSDCAHMYESYVEAVKRPAPQPLSYSDSPADPIVSDVEAIVRLLESREWAEHVATTPLGQRLETAVTVLVGECSQHFDPVKVDAKASVPSDAEIREVFLSNGFTIKPGHDDLKPYVYQAARDLLARYK